VPVQCGGQNKFLHAWKRWESVPAGRIFLGLPASKDAAGTRFVPAGELTSRVLPLIRGSPSTATSCSGPSSTTTARATARPSRATCDTFWAGEHVCVYTLASCLQIVHPCAFTFWCPCLDVLQSCESLY
jgi:hypothetical protein